MNEYRGHAPAQWQTITNGLRARPAQDRRPLPCRARIVWEHGGEEIITTTAIRYDPSDGAVYVLTRDGRNRFTGAWLRRDDVEV